MKTLTIREVPDEVYTTLRDCAVVNHRSLQEQVVTILERETKLVRGSQASRVLRWRQRLAGRQLGNIVADIRRERQR
ncbi:MAG: hypothetical protein NTV22_02925 [bacterium]|nr:hypothetical protein [bacterium]